MFSEEACSTFATQPLTDWDSDSDLDSDLGIASGKCLELINLFD